MKKSCKKITLWFIGIYAVYVVIILGGKYYYDHPNIAPTINEGKIDDWQYSPHDRYHHDDRSPFELLVSLDNISAHYVAYLIGGFFTFLVLYILTLIGVLGTLNLRAGISLLRLKSKNKFTQKQAWAKIAISLPALFFLAFILSMTIYTWCEITFWLDDWQELLFAAWFLLLGLAWLIITGYLFISGLMNWGSEKKELKKLGRRKFLWSLIYGLPVWLLVIQAWLAIDSDSFVVSSPDIVFNSSPIMTLSNDSMNVKSTGLNTFAPMNMVAESAVADDTIGLAVGGANDVDNFRENIKNDYLPEPTDLTYEGLFYDYYFDTGSQTACDKLFCPSYSSAISKDPYTGEDQYYLSVGLNSGVKASDFQRKKLNLVVVLDISGSMSSRFDRYYYDGERTDDTDSDKSKMEIADETIVNLMKHLQDNDRFSVVLFDHDAYLAKPFRLVKDTDMTAIAGHVLEITPQGSTDMSKGMDLASEQFARINLKDPDYENRIIFLTDAMPNTGDTSESGLFGRIRQLALERVYTTFIGIGVDLNSELIKELTEVRGANYYSVHSALDFKRRLADEFEYMVTPLVFDLNLTLDAPGWEITKVYGSPEADQASGRIMSVNTLFPSASSGGENKGGLVLLQLRKRDGATNDQIRLRTSYEDRAGNRDGSDQTVTFASESEVYPNTGIRKGILLTRYASVLQDWMLSSRYDDLNYTTDRVKYSELAAVGPEHYPGHGIIPITWPLADGRWERGSRPLTVNSEYAPVFQTLRDYFARETAAIGDDTLLQEQDILDLLILKSQGSQPIEPTGHYETDVTQN